MVIYQRLRKNEFRQLWNNGLRHALRDRFVWRGSCANDGHVAAESNGQYAYGTHYAGTTTYAGAYHPPTVVNQYYGTGCYNCGGWGGAAAGVAVGAAVGVAAASVANADAAAAMHSGYVVGDIYAALPAGCGYSPVGGVAYYTCGGAWFSPYYGANGMYYRAVQTP